MSDSDSPQRQLMEKWHEGFQARSLDLLKEPLHDDFTYATYPRSLNRPVQNKDQWCAEIAQFLGQLTGMDRTIHSVIDIPGKVITHYSGTVKTTIGVDLFREAITIATIVSDEKGNLKILKVEEFIDSKVDLEAMEKMVAAMSCKGT